MTSNRPLSYGCWDSVLLYLHFHPKFRIPVFSTINKRIPIRIHYLELSHNSIQFENLVFTNCKPNEMDMRTFSRKFFSRFLEYKLVIQNLKLGALFGGPLAVKLNVRNLNIHHSLSFESNISLLGNARRFLTKNNSFPLQSLEISHNYLLRNDVIHRCHKLILSKQLWQTNEVNHQRVHIRTDTGIFDRLNNLIAEWIAHGYNIGKHFSWEYLYQDECQEFLHSLQHLHGAKRSLFGGAAQGYCFTIPKNQEAEINVWGTSDDGKRIINIRIDPYGTAKILEK